VIVCERGTSLRPVGIIALVTPRIRANALKRAAFVARCCAALADAAGLVVIDAIPGSEPTPCAELAFALGLPLAIPPMVAVSFRTALRDGHTELDVWVNELSVGQPLPSVPLSLHGGPVIVLDLEGTYNAAIEAIGS
jgi:hypothetical protein